MPIDESQGYQVVMMNLTRFSLISRSSARLNKILNDSHKIMVYTRVFREFSFWFSH